MIPDIGFFALLFALAVSFFQTVLPFSRKLALVSWVAASVSFGCLIYSHAVSDFSVLNVYLNSHTLKPLIYKITGTWGNHEGSMMLWAWILTSYGAAFAWLNKGDDARLTSLTLRIQGLLGFGFFAFIVLTSNPFVRVFPVPSDGQGLNPLLQDVGLAMHPPMLYTGYVGFSLTFSYTLALLLTRGATRENWQRLRPWVLFSWAALTFGIGLGSWWAYRELGWGGFWFWDPVENASLLPWLAATALTHSLILSIRRGQFYGWTGFLGILTFCLSLLGTFLVRSGVLTSVHAFANDPKRGMFILGFLAAVAGGGFLVFALRQPDLKGEESSFRMCSKIGGILVNNLLLLVACGTVMLGTIYPLLLELLAKQSVSVGAPYFNATFTPLAVPMILLAGIVPVFGWQEQALSGLKRYIIWLCLAIAVVAALHFGVEPLSAKGFLTMTAGVFLIVSMLWLIYQKRHHYKQLPPAFWGMCAAHIGVGILVLGLTGASDWAFEKEVVLHLHESVDVGSFQPKLEGVDFGHGRNYIYREGNIHLFKNGKELAVLKPQNRFYPVEKQQTLESAIYSQPFYDFYAAMGEVSQDKGLHAVRFYIRPLISWVWLGCLLMGCGGLLAILHKKHKEMAS